MQITFNTQKSPEIDAYSLEPGELAVITNNYGSLQNCYKAGSIVLWSKYRFFINLTDNNVISEGVMKSVKLLVRKLTPEEKVELFNETV